MSENKIDKVVTESMPSINKLILIENGRGGLKVKYNIAQTINGVINAKKRQEEVNRPVQIEIREGFKMLKEHLLKGIGIPMGSDNAKAMLLAKTVVTTVIIDKKDQIQVGGYMLSGGTHHAPIATPFLTADYYHDFSDMNEVVDKICEESKLFMSGTKSADKKVIVLDYLTTVKDVANAEDDYSRMTEAEIAEITKEALENSGLRIIIEDGVECIGTAEEVVNNQISMVIEDDEEENDFEKDESKVDIVSEIKEPEFELPIKSGEQEDEFSFLD